MVPTGKRRFEDIVGRNDLSLVRLYRLSTGGLGGVQWPDGKPLLDQPVKLVRGFGVIASTLQRYESKRSG